MRDFLFLTLSAFLLSTPCSAATFAEETTATRSVLANHHRLEGNWAELKPGWNLLVLKVTDPQGRPVENAAVAVDYDLVDRVTNPPNQPVLEKGHGYYEKKIHLAQPGYWRFKTSVDKGRFKDRWTRIQRIKD